MKKIKQSPSKSSFNLAILNPEIKASRITINSRICNQDKFNVFFNILDLTKDYKNIISQYCYSNLTSLVTHYSDFIKNYNLFTQNNLNSWERQTIFAEISGHYFETATRYLSQASYVVQKQNYNFNKNTNIIKIKTKLNILATFIDKNSNLIFDEKIIYKLDFDINAQLISLNNYLINYQKELDGENENKIDNKNIIRLEKLIFSYERMIKIYEGIKQFKLNKPIIYNRLINLITNKKLRLLTKVKLAQYQTGTHARHLDNAQLSIVKDLTNTKYQYFLKIRKNSTLVSREPKLKISNETKNKADYELKLAKYNEDNFIFLPLVFNNHKLKQIGRNLDTVLSKDNPQILLKSEQLRIGQSSRKIHLIFKYEESSKLGEIIESGKYINPNEGNTLGLDVNIKHNLLADSNGKFYDDLLNLDKDEKNKDNKQVDNKINNKIVEKNKLIENINEIVLLQSIESLKRTVKQKYRYQKLLRCNESLLKTYLSGLIKDWKNQNILHLVMEDLNFINDKGYYIHQGVKIKYSRLARLLRLSQIKLWIAGIAEKQGLFTHLVNPAYTSQECSVCHHISSLNRVKQEVFKCTNKSCTKHNLEVNADVNSALNIKNRILHKELKSKLSKDNVYLCSRPKPIYYKSIKNIINEVYKSNGVVTELLPMNMINSIQLKEEASSFRAR